jgi:hypothetical protein
MREELTPSATRRPSASPRRGASAGLRRVPAAAIRGLVAASLWLLLALPFGALAAMAQDPSGTPGGSSTPVTSGAPAGPADALVAGLLEAADLPPAMNPATDVQKGTDYDIDDAAFMANEGIRIVSRTWGMSSDAGPSIVFDFRMQFASPDQAAAYLKAAMPILSEAATTGLTPLTGVPVMGDETYGFGRDTDGTAGPVTIRAYLFRVGSVVAKVVAGGADITGDQAQAIAQAAAGRVAAAGPPVPGSPRPAPTRSPSLLASPAPSVPAGDLTGLLLAHIPADIASTCTPDPQRLWEGELVTLVCGPSDADIEVTYSGFDTAEHMGAAYQSSLDTIDLSSLAASCDTGTWTGTYQLEGQDVGQATCWSEPNGQAIMWSDDRLSILSVAVSPSLDASSLYQWWLDAGPDL